MSLIALPAFLHRRREDTPMPETVTAPKNNVVMQFLTRGGAVVEVEKESRVRYWDSDNPTARDTVYQYRCLGCDYESESQYVGNARSNANDHAAACWSMSKPGVQAGVV